MSTTPATPIYVSCHTHLYLLPHPFISTATPIYIYCHTHLYLMSHVTPTETIVLSAQKYGLEVFLREPNSYTPHLHSNRSLTLGGNYRDNYKQIAQFSKKDAEKYSKYEQFMLEMGKACLTALKQER